MQLILSKFCSRLVTSVYEAAHIGSILTCQDRGMDNTPLWNMYVTAAVQLLMVVNASFNLPIYLFAGQHFRQTLCEMLGLRLLLSFQRA